jgi:hypothetical protein
MRLPDSDIDWTAMLETLTRNDFADLPAGALAFDHAGVRLPLEVLRLRDLPPSSPRPHPFAVVLAGPASPLLPQGIHPLLHPAHGRLDVFIVPIARTANRAEYEIIFN